MGLDGCCLNLQTTDSVMLSDGSKDEPNLLPECACEELKFHVGNGVRL